MIFKIFKLIGFEMTFMTRVFVTKMLGQLRFVLEFFTTFVTLKLVMMMMSTKKTRSRCSMVTKLAFKKFFPMFVPFVSIEQDLSPGLPATLVTWEALCSMHCLDVLV